MFYELNVIRFQVIGKIIFNVLRIRNDQTDYLQGDK
jgi:hypothetical protein